MDRRTWRRYVTRCPMAPVTTYDMLADLASVDFLFAEIVDTGDKVEVVVALSRTAGVPRTTGQLATPPGGEAGRVAGAPGGLPRAGVVDTWRDDGAGWWLDPHSGWSQQITAMIRLYERDR